MLAGAVAFASAGAFRTSTVNVDPFPIRSHETKMFSDELAVPGHWAPIRIETVKLSPMSIVASGAPSKS